MGWLGRLVGREPPRIPPGGRAFVAMCADEPPVWSVRYAMPGEDETTDRPRVRGTSDFTRLDVANACRAWVAGEVPTFSYPSGAA